MAARTCHECGHKFKRKPVPRGLKITAAVVSLGIAGWVGASAVVPRMTDPEQGLEHAARQLSEGPKNPDDARKRRDKFDKAVRNYLLRVGGQSSPDVARKLTKVLPSSAFEVHVIDLPRGLKVVEIDTVLQAAPYLVMKNGSNVKVFPLAGLEVFDDAKIINESAGPMLVLLGHTGGEPPHHPQVRVYALLPDDITDETEKLLPAVRGEGSARFAKNNRDILLDLSLMSLGQSEKLFDPSSQDDGTAHQLLEWRDAHYVSRYDYGSSPFAPVYAVARCMRYPDLVETHKRFLGKAGGQLVRENKSPEAGNFQVRRVGSTGDKVSYEMKGNVGSFLITVGKANGTWSVVETKTTAVASAPVASPPQAERPVPEKKEPPAPKPPQPPAARTPSKQETTTATVPSNREPQPAPKQPAVAAKPPVPPPPAHGEKAEITRQLSSGTVNVRSGPSTDAKPVAEVTRGAPIEILDKKDGWYHIRTDGKEGYVYGGLVDYKRPDAYTTAVITKSKVVTDTHRNTVSRPQVGDRLVILGGIENDKYKVQLANGKTGYVDKDAVDVKIEAPPFVP